MRKAASLLEVSVQASLIWVLRGRGGKGGGGGRFGQHAGGDGVGISGVAHGVVGSDAVVVGSAGGQARVGVGGDARGGGGDLREGEAVGEAFDGEAAFVAGVVGPGDVDLARGNGRRGQTAGGGGGGWTPVVRRRAPAQSA